MNTEKFLPRATDTWTWQLAQFSDVDDIIKLFNYYSHEIDAFTTYNPDLLTFNIKQNIVKQNYQLSQTQIIVARDKITNELISWAWCKRGFHMPYSDEEAAEAAFAHVNLDLPNRQRITILAQIIQQWILWAHLHSIPVLISSSVRQEQIAFMRLHKLFGFDIHGSIAFKRIDKDL